MYGLSDEVWDHTDQKTWLVVESEPQVAALKALVKPNIFVSTWREAVTARQFDRILVLASLTSGSEHEQAAKYDWCHTVAMTRRTPEGSLMLVGGTL